MKRSYTQCEEELSRIRIHTRVIKRTLRPLQSEQIARIEEEYAKGRTIVSRLSDWERLQPLPDAKLASFIKQVFFNFSIVQGVPVINRIHQLDTLHQTIIESFHSNAVIYFTSLSLLDIVDQCHEWLYSLPNLDDYVVWDDQTTKESGLSSFGIEYVYTILNEATHFD
jgi:hypothetical protein